MIFVGRTAVSAKLKISSRQQHRSSKMIESDSSYRDCTLSGRQPPVEDRLAPGPAFLAVVGLSLLCWAVILVPLAAIFHR
jgi:hypothetical protein